MARVELPLGEIDPNFRIEAAIADKLRKGETAEVSKAIIEKTYAVLEHVNHGEEATPFHSLSRFDQAVAVLDIDFDIDDAEYEDRGDDIQFRRQKPR